MAMKQKRKLKRLIKIIAISAAGVFAVAIIITNFFIPVLYLTAYFHFGTDKNPLGQMRVRYLDVGYGDCALIELPDGKTMLIDGGTGTYGNVYKLLDTLNKSKINTIDYLICTSVKSEHCGSLAEILKYKKVGTAYIPYVTNIYLTDEYAAFYRQLLQSGAHIETAEYGKGKYSSEYGYFFDILSPMAATYPDSEYNVMNTVPTTENIENASIVLWLEYAGRAFMFLSDATAEVQSKIADLLYFEKDFVVDGVNVNLSDCTVLKTAKHCAANSTKPVLYDLIRPEAAIISVGKNAQSSPSLMEIANLQLYVNDKIYRTDIHGTISVTVDKQEYCISKEK